MAKVSTPKSKTVIQVVTPKNKEDKAHWEAIEADAERWEKREVGAAEKHAQPISDELAKEIDQKLDEALAVVTIRFQPELIQDFRRFAREDGLKYQSLMRSVLTKYAANRKAKLANEASTPNRRNLKK